MNLILSVTTRRRRRQPHSEGQTTTRTSVCLSQPITIPKSTLICMYTYSAGGFFVFRHRSHPILALRTVSFAVGRCHLPVRHYGLSRSGFCDSVSLDNAYRFWPYALWSHSFPIVIYMVLLVIRAGMSFPLYSSPSCRVRLRLARFLI